MRWSGNMRASPLSVLIALIGGATLLASAALAVPPHRSFYDLPSSNGYSAVVVDFQQARAHHFRDHLFATEEPVWDAAGDEIWADGFPQSVYSRDLLYDAYFGLRSGGSQLWLTDLGVDLDASGWAGTVEGGPLGGTNLVQQVQTWGDLEVTSFFWAPWGLERPALTMVLRVENTGSGTATGVSAFSLHNLHLGEGRPGPDQETGAEAETVHVHAGGIEERGFAGVTALVPLGTPSRWSAYHSGAAHANPWQVVTSGSGDLAEVSGDQGSHDDSISALQWDHGDLAPGGVAWFGLVLAYHGDLSAYDTAAADATTWIAGRGAEQVISDERAAWQTFLDGLTIPAGLSADEQALYHQSAVVLRMAQVREESTFLREHLSADGEPRYSIYGSLPGEVTHDGAGGMLASLPPGRWTYAWPRDGAYAIAGMSVAGLHDEARDALLYMLDAVSDRYRSADELSSYPILPYAISLCRHHGFGIEESDTLFEGDFNFEFDGAGLFLWSLGEYTRASGDWTLVEERWTQLQAEVADFLVALIDPTNGLIMKDSSIWEHHWLGKERYWAYTSITAARGLCEAADMADHMGETTVADDYRSTANGLRDAILAQLVDSDGVVAQTFEELNQGSGYYDAATAEVVSMGLVSPDGDVGPATIEAIVDQLQTPDGPGFSRNDDAWDPHGLSPWGSVYDSDEWVWADLRTAVAARHLGDDALADDLVTWISDQSVANYLAIGETYDPNSADYTNNAPMVGFGPGLWILAINQRQGTWLLEPACGSYPDGDDDDVADDDDSGPDDDDSGPDDDDSGPDDDDSGPDDDDTATDDDDATVREPPGGAPIEGCDCGMAGSTSPTAGLALLLIGLLVRRRRVDPTPPSGGELAAAGVLTARDDPLPPGLHRPAIT